jgi:4-alpha-glucanotransferase
MSALPDDLARLADAYGVATSYLDWDRKEQPVSADAVRLALRAMGVSTDTPEEVQGALDARAAMPWTRLVPPTTVVTEGHAGAVRVSVPEDAAVRAVVSTEAGDEVPLGEPGPAGGRHERGGRVRVARRMDLPRDLPLGYHRVSVEVDRGAERQAEGLLVVAPASVPGLDRLPPQWGWMLQLYALRSSASWGVGDLGDLRELATWSGEELGAGFLVCNPLHAAAPTLPLEPSPYYPSSRRFTNPLYLRIADLPELAAAPDEVRREIDALGAPLRAANRADRIDRDAAWTAKLRACELLRPVEAGRAEAFAAYRAERGEALRDFATFCALAERHGTPWQRWPADLRHPDAPDVAAAHEELADRIDLHSWLQFCCEEQLAEAQRSATAAGMPIGVIHDLAVGVDPGGADGWALQDHLATDVTVGAPPDSFNQRGQDWRLPPLRPDRLAETGYAPFREMMAAVLRHAGGIRIDHVMGLFRLWWVPEGRPASDGTYVSYPAEELLAILALEAHRAGAVVVGEDLGTVADEVRHALRSRGIFGSRVLYFERTEPDEDRPEAHHRRLRPEEYPPQSLASVATHDLPTAAGWWADEAIHTQAALGLLGESTDLDTELARMAGEKDELAGLLRAEGFLAPGAEDPQALREAMHAFLARCGSLLVAAQPADAVGDVRQPNLPGTTDEYPNWRLPVAEPLETPSGEVEHRPLLVDDLRDDPRVHALAAVLREGRRDVAGIRVDGERHM